MTPVADRGPSFAHTFDDAKAPSKHITQYFEMFGHRSIYHDGWRAVCPWPGTSFAESGRQFGSADDAKTLSEQDAKRWELYNVEKDFAENHNLAANRDKLIEMIASGTSRRASTTCCRWIHAASYARRTASPARVERQTLYVYYPGTQTVPNGRRRENPQPPAQHHRDGRDLRHPVRKACSSRRAASTAGIRSSCRAASCTTPITTCDQQSHVGSKRRPDWEHKLSFEFEPTGKAEPLKGRGAPGTVRLFVNGKQVGAGELSVTVPLTMGLGSGVAVGRDAGAPVGDGYNPPFPFTGTLRRVAFDVSGEHVVDHEAELRAALAHQ